MTPELVTPKLLNPDEKSKGKNLKAFNTLTLAVACRIVLLLATFIAVAMFATGCVEVMNNAEGSGAHTITTIPVGASIFVKERDVDNLGWHSKLRKQLGEAGYTILDSQGNEGTFVFVYDYETKYDVFHYTLRGADFVVKTSAGVVVVKSHFEHMSLLSEDTLLKTDLEKVITAMKTGKSRNRHLKN